MISGAAKLRTKQVFLVIIYSTQVLTMLFEVEIIDFLSHKINNLKRYYFGSTSMQHFMGVHLG